jgi:predicted flavoprotein YhiN
VSEVIDVLVVGGGAAGFFGAIQCIERNPALRVVILEKSEKVLSKVRISGGGRCNVTHACFDPEDLCSYYPRGNKELLGPFHRFMCGDMMAWLDEHGVSYTYRRRWSGFSGKQSIGNHNRLF